MSKFVTDTKLGGVADRLGGCTAFYLDRLENWADRKLIKFNKEKCKLLHLRRNKICATQLESSFSGEDLESPGRHQIGHEPGMCRCGKED